MPSNKMLVAVPRIFGPVTMNATETTPSPTAVTSLIRSGRSRASSLRSVPRRSLLRSTGIPVPGPIGPLAIARMRPPPPITPPPPRPAGR